MDVERIVAALRAKVGDVDIRTLPSVDQPTILVPAARVVRVMAALRNDPTLAFVFLSDVTAVDWWPAEPRFEVVYHLASFAYQTRLRVKARVAGTPPVLPTVTGLWPGADWLEREVWDFFGIVFAGHPDLRRLLMPEDWEGHPLRKDYPVQVRQPVKVYEPLQLTAEEFRANLQADRDARGTTGEG